MSELELCEKCRYNIAVLKDGTKTCGCTDDKPSTPKVDEVEELAQFLLINMRLRPWETTGEEYGDCRNAAEILIGGGYHRTTSSVELVEALEMAINTVECDSYGLDSKGNKFELPWYRAAKKAIAKFKEEGSEGR